MNEPPKNALIRLTDKGDLIIEVHDVNRIRARSFLVSSHILTIASSVFAAMFDPRFKEGQQMLQSRQQNGAQHPTILLDEDEVNAMDFIFSNLHYKYDRIKNELSALEIADIAVQSDKYDLHGVLAPWISLWCHPVRFPVSPARKIRDMGYGLLVAYLFQSPSLLAMSSSYVKSLPPYFAKSWSKNKFMPRLPKSFQVRLEDEITRAQKEIRLQVLSKVDELQRKETFCAHEGVSTFNRLHATQYLDILRHFDIWPSLGAFETSSTSELVSLIRGFPNPPTPGCLHHSLPKCPLRAAMKELFRAVCTIHDSMEGVPLSMVVGGSDENGDGSSDDSDAQVFHDDD